jgi:hypothetical protein
MNKQSSFSSTGSGFGSGFGGAGGAGRDSMSNKLASPSSSTGGASGGTVVLSIFIAAEQEAEQTKVTGDIAVPASLVPSPSSSSVSTTLVRGLSSRASSMEMPSVDHFYGNVSLFEMNEDARGVLDLSTGPSALSHINEGRDVVNRKCSDNDNDSSEVNSIVNSIGNSIGNSKGNSKEALINEKDHQRRLVQSFDHVSMVLSVRVIRLLEMQMQNGGLYRVKASVGSVWSAVREAQVN